MKQGGTEPVIDFLSRLIKTASIKNVPEKVLLSVAINGLKSEIKALVVTQNPKTMEQLRQIAILAEKSQSHQVTALETYENLLTEIKSIKDQMVKKSEVNQMTQGQQYAQPYMPQQYSESWQYVQQPPVQRAPIFGERVSQRVRFYEPRERSRRPNPRFTRARSRSPVTAQVQSNEFKTRYPRMITPPPCGNCLGMCMVNRCPAQNAVCYNCNRIGHFSRACRKTLAIH